MKRDTLKTLAGLIIIGGIVVATFLYGSAQRQAQVARDQEAKKQQQEKAQELAKEASPSATPTVVAAATPTSTATPAPGATATPTPTPSASPQDGVKNTAPVQSPSSSSLQGSKTGGSALGTTATTTPEAGAAGDANLPDTGPELAGVLGMGSMAAMVLAVHRSRRAMLNAARSRH